MTGPLGNSEFCFPGISIFPSTSLFTSKPLSVNLGPVYMEGGCHAPAIRATRLEELKHSAPLRGLSFERPLSTTNITADRGNFFPSYFSFLQGHGLVLFLRLVYYIDLFRLTVILFGR